MIATPSSDRTTLWRVPALGGLELHRARHASHAFPGHWHETWVIELVTAGADAFDCAGKAHVACAGDLIVMRPLEAHTGRPAGRGVLCYRSLYPDDALMSQCGLRPGVSRFPQRVIRDPQLAEGLAVAHAALERDPHDADAGAALITWLNALVLHHACHSEPPAPCARSAPAIERARIFMEQNAAAPLKLEDASRVAGLSPFHFARAFRRRHGVAPHAYLVSARIERARTLLRAGAPIADTALATGFADQSHMTRHFKRMLGITPGRYAGMSKFVQDDAIEPGAG